MDPGIALSIFDWLRDFQGEGLFPSPGQFRPATVESPMKPNDIIFIELFGRPTRCRVLALHGRYTIDVERLSDGQCFRVSGL